MSDQRAGNRRKLIAAIIVILIILSGIVFAVGNKDGDNKEENKTVKTEQKQKIEQADEQSGEVAGAAVVPPVETPAPQTPAPASSSKKRVATTASTSNPTPQPQNTPQIPPTNNIPPEEPDEEQANSCFALESDIIFVPVGGNSESFTLSTEDGSAVLWWSYSESLDTSDAGENVKPGFPVYVVIESGYNYMAPTASITLHIHARDTAAPGEYCPDDDITQLALMGVDPETFVPLFRVPFDVTITANTAQ